MWTAGIALSFAKGSSRHFLRLGLASRYRPKRQARTWAERRFARSRCLAEAKAWFAAIYMAAYCDFLPGKLFSAGRPGRFAS
jgi:hypothetical protein